MEATDETRNRKLRISVPWDKLLGLSFPTFLFCRLTISQVSHSVKANPTFTYNGSYFLCSARGSEALLERSGLPRRNRFEILMIILALR
ncbi:uncharacterized protein ARMOST_10397 [Armillaria ostoyae]|uniref:Uncharacterized protein n=1 Tax=Armillaria ostoyae TaxID=47428 RepID=A0A284RE90_ARMOS|nr:uncharacterized protein ARMOST_10397 [Armillaria ostoyae]